MGDDLHETATTGREERSELAAALPTYELGPALGRGAFAVVYAARHRRLEREVAVKRLSPELLSDPDARARFGAEARMLASLDHPHVVRVHDYVEEEQVCALVMERLRGGSLADRQQTGPLHRDQACAVMIAALYGLEHAHRSGVLHRDVKPDNLLFGDHDLLKVGDFGIARVLGARAAQITATGSALGTPAFMAPEQVSPSAGELSPATDIYAVGAILYELLAGAPVFSRDLGLGELLIRRVSDDPPHLGDVAPDVPDELADTVMRALARDPSHRYGTARGFAVALEATLGPGAVAATGVPIHRLDAERQTKRRPSDRRAQETRRAPSRGELDDTIAIRAVVADDEPLLREAVASLLRHHDIDVVAEVGDADAAREAVAEAKPDIAIMDIRMPPERHLDGLNAAIDIRARTPEVAILLLSNRLETQYLDALLGSNAQGVGYLLKDRVAGASEFVDAVRRVAAGACVIDPEVVAMLVRPARRDPLKDLSDRERQVLALMAEGRSNPSISTQLDLSPQSVEKCIRRIFSTLGLMHEPDYHRRVLAVLAHLGLHEGGADR